MTREVAKRVLKSLDYYLQNRFEDYGEQNHDAMMMAIKALGQEPCDDAISRKALFDMCKKEIDHISKNWQNYHSPSEAKSGFAYIATNIYDLPPVNPQPKSGHWNTYELAQGGIDEEWLECSECMWSNALVIPRKYCPNCGAKMIESEG